MHIPSLPMHVAVALEGAGWHLLESEYAGGETLDSWLELARPQVAATVKTLT